MVDHVVVGPEPERLLRIVVIALLHVKAIVVRVVVVVPVLGIV